MTIIVGNAPCSWGVLEFGLEGAQAGYVRVLDEMAASGYGATELGDWGFMPTDPGALREAVAARALPVVGAFVPVEFANAEAHAAGRAQAVKTAQLLVAAGQQAYIVLADDNGRDPVRTRHAGRIQPEQGLSEAQWATFARGVEDVAEAVLSETGLRSVFHFHCAGFVETPEEVDRLMASTRPDLVGLCFDTGHYAYGGGDPVAGLRRHADRVWHVHFKDCEPAVAAQARAAGWDYFEAVRAGVFCELGRGTVDFVAVRELLTDLGYSGWIIVEQDVLPGMGTPLESARRNRAFLRGIGL